MFKFCFLIQQCLVNREPYYQNRNDLCPCVKKKKKKYCWPLYAKATVDTGGCCEEIWLYVPFGNQFGQVNKESELKKHFRLNYNYFLSVCLMTVKISAKLQILRKKCRNSTRMMCHYLDLGSASDGSSKLPSWHDQSEALPRSGSDTSSALTFSTCFSCHFMGQTASGSITKCCSLRLSDLQLQRRSI